MKCRTERRARGYRWKTQDRARECETYGPSLLAPSPYRADFLLAFKQTTDVPLPTRNPCCIDSQVIAIESAMVFDNGEYHQYPLRNSSLTRPGVSLRQHRRSARPLISGTHSDHGSTPLEAATPTSIPGLCVSCCYRTAEAPCSLARNTS